LEPERFRQILGRFPEVEHLELQGEGEPLLHSGFFEMARLAHERGIRVSTITNGSLFSSRRIEQIIESGIDSLLVSIESAEAEEFRAIRGGKLEVVNRGIRALISARRESGLDRPSVGLAVTVLKSTRRRLADIARFYNELELDGGILLHMLSSMETYARFYDASLRDEILSPLEQALVWAQYSKILERELQFRVPRHFWERVLSDRDRDPSDRLLPRSFRSCPWLDRALFVDRLGFASACPNIKEGRRLGFGALSTTSRQQILERRKEMGRLLAQSRVPACCQGCFIAESIATRMESPIDTGEVGVG
jgi:MoaA/NifB/PqqE/SkfB family radical SAM enzyme